jgi:hypothetical protein
MEHKQNKAIAIVLGIIVVAGAFWFYPSEKAVTDDRVMGVPETSYEGTFIGTPTCLPHRDTSGPQTLECAMGIRFDDGTHYALDMSGVSGDFQSYTGRISVSGTVVPIEAISSDVWQKYDIQGIMKVSSAEKL